VSYASKVQDVYLPFSFGINNKIFVPYLWYKKHMSKANFTTFWYWPHSYQRILL